MTGGIRARGVRRTFGDVVAVDHMDLTARPGEVTALVGPNGSGKTTLLLMMATLLRPDSGDIEVAGFDTVHEATAVRESMGWMPDVFGVYESLTAREVLRFAAAAYRIAPSGRRRAHRRAAGAGAPDGVHRPAGSRALPRPEAAARPGPRGDPRPARSSFSMSRPPGSTRAAASSCATCCGGGRPRVAPSSSRRTCSPSWSRPWTASCSSRPDGRSPRRPSPTWPAEQHRPWRLRALDPPELLARLQAYGLDPQPSANDGCEVLLTSDEAAADLLARLLADGVRVVSSAPTGSSLETAYLAMTEERR